jgi:hypothetical protein
LAKGRIRPDGHGAKHHGSGDRTGNTTSHRHATGHAGNPASSNATGSNTSGTRNASGSSPCSRSASPCDTAVRLRQIQTETEPARHGGLPLLEHLRERQGSRGSTLFPRHHPGVRGTDDQAKRSNLLP